MKQKFKGVRAKIFPLIDYLQSDTELLVSEMQKNGVTSFVSEIKCVETYPDFEKIQLVRIVQNGLQGFIVKNNNNGESTEKQS